MARCEDWPCCGHEAGCCPDYDDAGRQLNMKCVCGTTLPLNSRYSICEACMRQGEDDFDPEDDCGTGDDSAVCALCGEPILPGERTDYGEYGPCHRNCPDFGVNTGD